MKVVFTRRARADLDERVAYSLEHFGQRTTEKTFSRLQHFIHQTLAAHPSIGRRHSDHGFLETWVPRTPFFVIYRVDGEVLTVLAVYHHAQDRSAFAAEDDPD